MFSDRHARADEDARGEPTAAAHTDGGIAARHRMILLIVVASRERVLAGDRRMVPDDDRLEVQEFARSANLTMVSDNQFPRHVDVHPGPDHEAGADIGAE